jgi:hypothetical protein
VLERDSYKSARVPVPLLSYLAIPLPGDGAGAGGGAGGGAVARRGLGSGGGWLPEGCPTIEKFDRTCEVMTSKERPKKLTVLASDGRRYPLLCKRESDGDLRKDRMADELHPSPAGYALWAKDLEPAVRRALAASDGK